MQRCWWCQGDPVYETYHDQVWGRPEQDDRKLFEMLSLELFQAGLSWITVLRKQTAFVKAFANWDIAAIAAFDEARVRVLLANAGIIRNRRKIEAVIHNAQRIPAQVREHGSLAAYLWRFAPQDRQVPAGGFTRETLPLLSEAGQAMSKQLKRDGFKFTGPMVCHSFMQAVGMLNDHVADCDLCIY